MPLTSFRFLAFVVLVLLVYNATSSRQRPNVLLAASYVFYASFSLPHLLVLGFVTLVSYVGGRAIAHGRRGALPVSIVCVLVPLIGFKYLELIASFIAATAGANSPTFVLPPPIGISFFTFQSISYMVDVRRGAAAERDLRQLALHLALFPKLLAGPIERARDLLPQLRDLRPTMPSNLHAGAKIALWGFFCKLVVADNVGSLVDAVLTAPSEQSGASLAGAFGLYAFQIYFDFLGYTHIAIGVARCFNIDLSPNFLVPYSATSLREFWHRWHISLSSWFRDYLYVPLGGNRTIGATRVGQLLLVFVVSGLWHGAAFTFIAWGAFHGLAFAIEDFFRRYFGRPVMVAQSSSSSIRVISRRAVVFGVVTFGWILFRSPNLSIAWIAVQRIAFVDGTQWSALNDIFRRPDSLWFLVLLIVAVGLDASKQFRLTLEQMPTSPGRLVRELVYVNAFVVSMLLFGDLGVRDFTYFQF
jgi:alginate O-acetyltransferase complex protein AlgI